MWLACRWSILGRSWTLRPPNGPPGWSAHAQHDRGAPQAREMLMRRAAADSFRRARRVVQVGREDFGRSQRRLARSLGVVSRARMRLGCTSRRTEINVYRFRRVFPAGRRLWPSSHQDFARRANGATSALGPLPACHGGSGTPAAASQASDSAQHGRTDGPPPGRPLVGNPRCGKRVKKTELLRLVTVS